VEFVGEIVASSQELVGLRILLVVVGPNLGSTVGTELRSIQLGIVDKQEHCLVTTKR